MPEGDTLGFATMSLIGIFLCFFGDQFVSDAISAERWNGMSERWKRIWTGGYRAGAALMALVFAGLAIASLLNS